MESELGKYQEPNLDFQADLVIDQDNLDLELAKHPEKAAKWERRAIEAENHRDWLDNQVELKYAQIEFKIRSDYAAGQLAITEKAVHCLVVSDQEYVALKDRLRRQKYVCKILRLGVKRIRDNWKILDRLSKLYLAMYYAEKTRPTSPATEGQQEEPPSEERPKSNPLDEGSNLQKALNASMKARRAIRQVNNGT